MKFRVGDLVRIKNSPGVFTITSIALDIIRLSNAGSQWREHDLELVVRCPFQVGDLVRMKASRSGKHYRVSRIVYDNCDGGFVMELDNLSAKIDGEPSLWWCGDFELVQGLSLWERLDRALENLIG